jgi:diguanylate cyclase (GGDEF)-like protein/PAS domain S-box-containing protein
MLLAHTLGSNATAAAILASSAEEQYRSIFENAVEGIYQTTIDGRYLRVNPALARIYGYESPAALIDGLTDISAQLYVDPTRRDDFARIMREDGMVLNFEARIYRRDGSIIWISENARCVHDTEGGVRYYEGTVQDITERKTNEEKIRLLATVFDSVADGILIVGPDLRIQAVNPAYATIGGHSAEGLLGRPLSLFAPGAHTDKFVGELWETARTAGSWQGEVTAIRRSGEAFPAALSVTAVRAPSGTLEHLVLTVADISQRKYQEHQIRYQASFDRLTDLPNRWLVCERLGEAILRAQRAHSKVAVLFADLDRFKQVNDTLGHEAGDELLKLVARRLRGSTRVTDTVGRLGGDEFLIVAPDAADRAAGKKLAEKIAQFLSEPFVVQGREIYCGGSVGIAVYPEDGDNADELLRNADLAMYHAKRTPPHTYMFYDEGMREQAGFTLGLECELRRAVAGGEFALHYQPKVDLDGHHMIGAEALIRWHHPERGIVGPVEFIPIAEETGLIWEIGCWTLVEACRQIARWAERGIDVGCVSVNLSPRQFQDQRLVGFIQRTLEETGIAPARLELELTESAMIGDIEKAVTVLTGLKDLGIRLSIDDFGTGYSSLSYLKRFPIDTLKIDRSFVRDIAESSADPAIVGTIVNLAESLGFETIAEGVETEQQANVLKAQRCTRIQGFLISRPLDVPQFEAFLRIRAAA